MAIKKILQLRSSESGKVPSSLEDGEIAVNTADGKIFINKIDDDGNIVVTSLPTFDDINSSIDHTHDNLDQLNTIVDGPEDGMLQSGDHIIQMTRRFDDRASLADYSPSFRGELTYLMSNDVFCWFDYSQSKWIMLGTGDIVTKPGYGIGPSGTYSNGWEDEDDIDLHFESDLWGSTTNGTDAGKWNRYDAPTPSSDTGTAGPYEGSNMVYAEVSSGGDSEYFRLEFKYFAKLTRVAFYVQLEGSNAGTFELKTYNEEDGETTHYSITGDQGSAWISVDLDLTGSNAEAIYFDYHDASGYQGDLCLDAITIESED